jgi:uncharacterized membrane protein
VKLAKYIFLSALIAIVLLAIIIPITMFGMKTESGDPQYSPVASGAAVIVSWLTGLVAYLIINRSLKKETKKFVGALFGGMLGKLLIGMLAVILVAFFDRRVINEFVIVFFTGYFLFTAFEVYALMRNLRPEKTDTSEIAKDTKVSEENENK